MFTEYRKFSNMQCKTIFLNIILKYKKQTEYRNEQD